MYKIKEIHIRFDRSEGDQYLGELVLSDGDKEVIIEMDNPDCERLITDMKYTAADLSMRVRIVYEDVLLTLKKAQEESDNG